jgi:hypothetical protein
MYDIHVKKKQYIYNIYILKLLGFTDRWNPVFMSSEPPDHHIFQQCLLSTAWVLTDVVEGWGKENNVKAQIDQTFTLTSCKSNHQPSILGSI